MTAPGGLGAFVQVPARTLTDRTVPLNRPLLDVDGPLNPFHAGPHDCPTGFAPHRMSPGWLLPAFDQVV